MEYMVPSLHVAIIERLTDEVPIEREEIMKYRQLGKVLLVGDFNAKTQGR